MTSQCRNWQSAVASKDEETVIVVLPFFLAIVFISRMRSKPVLHNGGGYSKMHRVVLALLLFCIVVSLCGGIVESMPDGRHQVSLIGRLREETLRYETEIHHHGPPEDDNGDIDGDHEHEHGRGHDNDHGNKSIAEPFEKPVDRF
ncbi:hypothetical protein BIW11_07499 [Tropilaelaps mercedesae]|uniref:Uncharacterized protein n=1 Tax=Tropilaelaps mercedesae TaxID=418985 RepID=A0A1V9XU31_9ACAR|nr:hypothetical protein BIW11_07499 [Tropilaelaps mercedesae]